MENKALLGKILGEIYRTQKAVAPNKCDISDAHIFALVNGFQTAINEELEKIGSISVEQYDAVVDVLVDYESPERLNELTGFRDVEDSLKSSGVSRGEAIQIIKHLKANGQFLDVIEKFNSTNSPAECKTFNI